ncbi:MAG: hypothetical protein GXP08_06930 [Gammaproteobacteria bacterium]|nr:hypothetical protein [Gammaproteobacteria bacterium]
MNIKQPVVANFILITMLLINACGVDTDATKPADTKSEINEFNITGGRGVVDGTQQIVVLLNTNNSEPETFFDLTWDVDSSDPYSIKAYLSEDGAAMATEDDLLFLHLECGSNTTLYGCDEIGSIKCNIHKDASGDLSDDLYLRCGNGQNLLGEDPNPTVINELVPSFPKFLFVLFEACNTAVGEKRHCASADAIEVKMIPDTLL